MHVSPFIIVERMPEKLYGNSIAEYALRVSYLQIRSLYPKGLIFMVYVISKDGKQLMPCENVIARFLLESSKAKVKRREPFTIKLLYETTTYTQPLTLGVDTGSGTAGFAVANEKNEIVYRSEVIMRDDIKHKMDRRKEFRGSRRNRKIRYRSKRFLNRKSSKRKDRLNPTMVSKLNSHVKEIEYIKSILPITTMVFEVGHFDLAAMQNPSLRDSEIIHWGYQRGRNYGFANTKAMVRSRDGGQCQICHGKSKDKRLNVHHIVFKSKHGSDKEDNLITLCETCHTKLHAGLITANLTGKKEGSLKYATQMNIIRSQLVKKYPNAVETFGYVTSTNRQALGLTKYSHWLDASIIATGGEMPIFKENVVYVKRCVAKGDYKQTMGQFSDIKINRGKMAGFRRFDKVMYANKVGFIWGRDVRGYAILMDIYENKLSFSYLPWGMKKPKFSKMKRISARSSQLILSQRVKCCLVEMV